jgi:hypothetical protein
MKKDDEIIRRMNEPEPLRSLRLQKERIEAENERSIGAMFAEREAERLRAEIRKLGHEPCA